MDEVVVVGVLGLLVGLIVCFRGYVALRVVISLLGAYVGFVLGAVIVGGFTSDTILGTAAAWIGAIVGAVLLGALAYLFYQVAVLLGMASIGFALGSGLTAALGVREAWIVWWIGVATAVLLVVISLLGDLPAVLLVLLTAFGGANIAVTAVMLLVGYASLDELSAGEFPVRAWSWGAIALVLGVVGAVVQWRGVARSRRAMRETWTGSVPGSASDPSRTH